MTVAQLATYLQLNKLTVYKYIRDGRIPAVRLGRSVRVLRADVLTFLEAQKVAPARHAAVRRGRAQPAAPAPVRARDVPIPRPVPAERQAAERRPDRAPAPERGRDSQVPQKQSEEIYVGPGHRERPAPRDVVTSTNPLEWVILRGLH